MAKLSKNLTEEQFANGYWYATELREFAASLGIVHAKQLRKDELEERILEFLRTGNIVAPTRRRAQARTVKDVVKGLSLDLPIVNYSSNRETKDFIEREAGKLVPNFKRKPGTRYLLNRWREEQLEEGKPITYGDLVKQAIALNESKKGPLRVPQARYINFISDYMSHNSGATHEQAVAAWKELKGLDMPKTFAAWQEHQRKAAPKRRPARA